MSFLSATYASDARCVTLVAQGWSLGCGCEECSSDDLSLHRLHLGHGKVTCGGNACAGVPVAAWMPSALWVLGVVESSSVDDFVAAVRDLVLVNQALGVFLEDT